MPNFRELEQQYPDLVSIYGIGNLTAGQILALTKIGIRTLGDLRRYDPFHYARLLQAAANGDIDRDFPVRVFVDFAYERKSPADLIDAPLEVLEGIGPAKAELFKTHFGIQTVGNLANADLFVNNLH